MGEVSPLVSSSRALIIAPSWIGDAVMSEPLLARLKAQNPQRLIDVFAPSWVEAVYARMAAVADIFTNPFPHGAVRLHQRWQVAQRLKTRQYEVAYVLPNSLKSALLPWLAGISKRVGFTGEARYGLINERHRLDKQALPLMVQRFARLAEDANAPYASHEVSTPAAKPIIDKSFYPRLQSDSAHQQAALARLSLPPAAGAQPRVAFCPGAEFGPAKRWPSAHFAAVARALLNAGVGVWLFGSGKDHAIGEEIVAQSSPQVVNLCGQTSLADAIDLLATCQVVLCNDSGLMHVAAALGRPLVAIFGSSSPGFTPPLSAQAQVFELSLPCRPCFRRTCPLKHSRCLTDILPEQVLLAVQAQLSPA